MNKPLRVAVVGCGIGRLHVECWQKLEGHAKVTAICDVEEATVSAICDIDRPKARDVATKYEVPNVIFSLDELLQRDDIDVVDLCTPPYLHFEQSKAVLEAGKHAVCEKPLVSSLAEVDTLAAIERSSGKRLMPIFQYRFGHGLQKLKNLIDLGLAGDAFIGTAETAWRRRAEYYDVPWRGKWKTELGGCVWAMPSISTTSFRMSSGPPKTSSPALQPASTRLRLRIARPFRWRCKMAP